MSSIPVAERTGLEVEGLSVRYGGHLAVSEVALNVPPARITGLIGPNGAGKTTTFNAICGVIPPSSGTVRLDGEPMDGVSTHRRARMGIGRTFQRLEVFASLSVRENVSVGGEIRRSWSRRQDRPQLLGSDPDPGPEAETELILDRLGLSSVADRLVGELPTGQARLVELGRALAARPSILLLDEPASGLDDDETGTFGALICDLAASGLGILMVEHDVALVMETCSYLYVLDFGSLIAHGRPEEVRSNQAVLDAYLGGVAT